CCQHCTQILVARLLLFLSHIRRFRAKLSERQQLKLVVQLLESTLEPQLLCLVLQSLALVALDSSTHEAFIDVQIDDALIQMLLPSDDWYYTRHSTKFGNFVKYHAARILVYVGMGDRVGSRVNLFAMHEGKSSSDKKDKSPFPNEDEYICETCSTPRSTHTFSKSALSVEGILKRLLDEMIKQNQHLS
ncbi:hypothetical protein PENTCL1PPCAC_27978, partial [Pristionchus entomophagus]